MSVGENITGRSADFGMAEDNGLPRDPNFNKSDNEKEKKSHKTSLS